MIKIKRGLDLPIAGAPRQHIEPGPPSRTVALLGPDYPGMKPSMAVREGEAVRKGQVLFTDKKLPDVRYTAPASGVVCAIHRGERRRLQSVVIEVADDEQDALTFPSWPAAELAGLEAATVREQLLASGLWTALRTRPYGKVPDPQQVPRAIFVTAMDTHPLAASVELILAERLEDFRNGLAVLSTLTEGTVWVCRGTGGTLPSLASDRVREQVFAGPHPAGNPSTHVHFLEPVGPGRMVWVVPAQEVVAIGALFTGGRLDTDRVIALAGPQVRSPRLLRTRVGASVAELVDGELLDGDNRVIAGSVLDGHHAQGPYAWLGRLTRQITVLREGRERELFGYLSPGLRRHSVLNIYLSRLLRRRPEFTTSTRGSERAMVPLGNYEAVMPLDILPTQLLRALVVGDLDAAVALGALELVEEDLALCTYVCVGKYEYGPILRDNLTRIEQEG